MILTTPYLHVQAIRRRYRDMGRPTLCKPGGYLLNLSSAGVPAVGTETLATVTVDPDSDFVWLSWYYYRQDIPWDPEVAGNGEENDVANQAEIEIRILRTGEALGVPSFQPPILQDWWMNVQQASEVLGTFEGGTDDPIGLWRHYLPEPRIIGAGEAIAARWRAVESGGALQGMILYLSGVRLYTIGG